MFVFLLRVLVAALVAGSAGADLFGSNLGVGLGACDRLHPLLLHKWSYNHSSRTLESLDATPHCPASSAVQNQWAARTGHGCRSVPPTPLFFRWIYVACPDEKAPLATASFGVWRM